MNVSLLQDADRDHGPVADDFVAWSGQSFLDVKKQRKWLLIFVNKKCHPCPLFVSCWFGSLSWKNEKRLDQSIKVCSKLAGIKLNDLVLLYRGRAALKAEKIWSDSPQFPHAIDGWLLKSKMEMA